MLEFAQTTTLLEESNALSHGVAWRNWPKELHIKASVMGLPNDKCQCPQEQNIMKDRDWCGFGALICARAGKHNLHFTSAPLLSCTVFLLAVKSMQALECLVPFFYFPPSFGSKEMFSSGMPIQIWLDSFYWKNSTPVFLVCQNSVYNSPPSPSFLMQHKFLPVSEGC